MVDENIAIEDTSTRQWLKREFDELSARITALEQGFERLERFSIPQRENKSNGLNLLEQVVKQLKDVMITFSFDF